MSNLSRRRFGLAAAALAARALASAPPTVPPFPFYAMDTGLRGPDVPTLDRKVDLLRKLGFSGVGYTLNHHELPALLALLDRASLELSALYTVPSLEGKLDPALPATIKRLRGRPTRVELAITSKKHRPSDTAGDKVGADLLRRVSDLCGDSGPVVSVYPHRGFWTERVEDGVRLARLVGRKNVGTHFNLVHWKWGRPKEPAAGLLRSALPHLMAVTINGLKGDAIVSLDEGDFDLAGFLGSVWKVGYRGRVGLQGYGVPGRSADHLGRSMKRWRELMARLR